MYVHINFPIWGYSKHNVGFSLGLSLSLSVYISTYRYIHTYLYMHTLYWVDQKGHSGFSVRDYEKPKWTFWPNLYIHIYNIYVYIIYIYISIYIICLIIYIYTHTHIYIHTYTETYTILCLKYFCSWCTLIVDLYGSSFICVSNILSYQKTTPIIETRTLAMIYIYFLGFISSHLYSPLKIIIS